jgi:hypothetical protein
MRNQSGAAGPREAAVRRTRAFRVLTDGRARQRPHGLVHTPTQTPI